MKSTRKSVKRSLLVSAAALVLSIAMLIGTTFAWFTDSVTSGVNKIVAGNLDVDLEMNTGTSESPNWVSAEGKTIPFLVNGAIPAAGTQILWEPGCRYKLPQLRVINKGSLALKYKIQVTGIDSSAKLNNVITWTIDGLDINTEQHLTKEATSDAFTIMGEMSKDAGNEYMNETIDGVAITVYATQDTVENDSFGNQYDKDAWKGVEYYTLQEFNSLTELPEGTETVYVNLNGTSLEGGVTIGNNQIADNYRYTAWNDHNAPSGYPHDTGRTNTRETDNAVRYLYSTGKPAVNVVITGNVSGAKDTGDFNAGVITLKVPDAANVVFDSVTFGEGQMALGVWQESFESTTVDHRVADVTFRNCTFNGNWIQNGEIGVENLKLESCLFNKHENTAGIKNDGFDNKNNSYPIWIQGMGQCNVTIDGCTVNAVRPIKLWENGASGTVTIKNNTFNMEKCSIDPANEYKNVAILFRGSNVTLGNVCIANNTVSSTTAGLVCFYTNNDYPTLSTGATFKVYDNTLNNAKESVLWKSATEFKPAYYNKDSSN